ncbi:MAG: DUF4159 domain-containing protein [Alphaproteobacteria bacterium]|nr:DUF4159 domain-containing protein [Alphaproteobacteria bacterium]
MWSLGPLAFSAPWLLAALIALPALWWLLRATPPAPRRVRFPALRLLIGLKQEDETPARTPWWLLLLRFAIAGLLIVGLARPLLNPGSSLSGKGPLLLVVDDGWAAARDWTARERALDMLLDHAEQKNRKVALVTTAPHVGAAPADPQPFTDAATIRQRVKALAPEPWPVDRRAALERLGKMTPPDGVETWWLADSFDDGNAAALAERLARFGPLTVAEDAPTRRPRLMLAPSVDAGGLQVRVRRFATDGEETIMVRGSAADGRLLTREPLRFEPGQADGSKLLALPAEVRNQVERLEIEGEASAGTTALLDERWRRRVVGVAALRAEGRSMPLLGEAYYLEKALAPYSEVRVGPIEALLAQPPSMLIMPDSGAVPENEVRALENWMKAGGVLVRFAGSHLARGGDELVPVALRRGGRALGGAMSWAQPARLAPFPETSPFTGLAVPADVTVDRQVLAQPGPDLEGKTWARLVDGTPLVTGERRGNGWLVLFHVTANPGWSNLAISGLFVEMLQRLVALGAGSAGEEGAAALPPLALLDGFGRLGPPRPGTRPIPGRDFLQARVSPETPPGLYGATSARRALNLASSVGELSLLPALPAGAARHLLAEEGEVDLQPWLLTLALALAIADTLASLALRGYLAFRVPSSLRRAAILILLAAGAIFALPTGQGAAQSLSDPTAAALRATSQMRLAYVRTGNSEVDYASRTGLQGLRKILQDRTSVELGDSLEVDITRDELAFFPILYWPLGRAPLTLTPDSVSRVYAYIRNGGMILFDTQNQGGIGAATPDASVPGLQRFLNRLNLAPLIPIPADHVLARSFYLLSEFPGRWNAGTVYVEAKGDGKDDEAISSIILGGNDWAAAWAVGDQGQPLFPVVPGGERQREMAYRFGVNVVMYALTGNYKSDQVHLRFILERLGQ